MGDHSVVRELARLLALVLVGCGGTPRVPQMEAGQPTSDAFAEEIESPDCWSDAAVDAVVDAQDARIDADPFQCSTVTPLVLSDPMVISRTVAGGQTVTVQITMTDTDPERLRLLSRRGAYFVDTGSQLRRGRGRAAGLSYRGRGEQADCFLREARRVAVRSRVSNRRVKGERDIGFEPTTFSLGSKAGGLRPGLQGVVVSCKPATRLKATEQRVPGIPSVSTESLAVCYPVVTRTCGSPGGPSGRRRQAPVGARSGAAARAVHGDDLRLVRRRRAAAYPDLNTIGSHLST